MESFVIYNVPEDKGKININEERQPHKQTVIEDNEDVEISERTINKTRDRQMNKETKKVCIPYCVFNLSYVNHSYIQKGKVIAEKEKDEENEVF